MGGSPREFQGGGLWIEDEAGNGPVVKQFPEGEASAGHVVGIRGMPVCFDGCRRYVLESWQGVYLEEGKR